MKNKAINTLKYTGIVTLSQYIGKKKVKIAQFNNTGGASLFDFLADCLIGEELETVRMKRPRKIMLLHRIPLGDRPEDGYRYEPASGFIFLLEQPKKIQSSVQSRVQYSFLIHRDMLEAITDFSTLGLGLYANSATDIDVENFTAFCMLKFSRNAIASSSLVVDWDLIINNSGTNPSIKSI